MEKEIENYLRKYAEILINGNWVSVEIYPKWSEQFVSDAGVYAVKEEGVICYIGESGNIRKRMRDLIDTRNHSLRRKVGAIQFKKHAHFKEASPSIKYPSIIEDKLNKLFESSFEVSAIAVPIGRKELEERLIKKLNPKYNKRGKRKA